ncbi:helix-turn-helix domain-containing protein [Pedobacter sp. SYSU D00535]|uniref:helix-turn-helix domain-containing protein n=1 Tax=Pedobacter sp. SYSU D00535 TaxID=2810308 RepID=UPI001A9690CA|nr:helix-turn-helix domain-containing protein [Pedobacter sp. SYSU D00535]
MPKNIELELAYNFVQYTDRNVFLTGKAGTGKTTFLHHLKKTTAKRMAVVAPTGVAAINAGGVTIHSFFQMPFGPFIAKSLNANNGINNEHQKRFTKDKINLIQSLDLLVIDEISMVRADMLDGIDEILRRFKNRHKPFGGVQLLMIGDLHQLSPVVKEDDWKVLRPYYPNLYFFNSKALQAAQPISIELKHIYRQSDQHFIDLLNNVRENRIDQTVLNELNQRFIPGFTHTDEEGYITLTTHNATANDINQGKLRELKEAARVFTATVNNEFPEYSFPTVVDLEIKVGAQVMFVKNDSSREKLFYNGKIGKVSSITEESIYVKCPGDHHEIEVTRAEWQNIKYELNPETKVIEEKVIGSFIQYPLKLAWAITIHKSQGLTFERAIIDASSSFAHGQVYVALSRCKSFEGMVLSSPITLHSVKTDTTVAEYNRKADENRPGEETLLTSKISFQQSLLYELFSFKPVQSRFFYLKKQVEENDHLLTGSLNEDLNQIKTQADKEIYQVAETFERELKRILTEQELPEDNLSLQDRVKKASGYFSAKVEQLLLEPIKQLSVETDNKAVKKAIAEATEHLAKEVIVKLECHKLCINGFDTLSYLKTKANAEIDFSAKPIKAANTAVAPPSTIAHPDLYTALKSWRDNLARERKVPVYLVLPSKVLADLTAILPISLSELEQVKGFGKQKIKQLGAEILELISSYCRENGVERKSSTLGIPREEKPKTDTKKMSLELFKAGKTVEQIAQERGLTTSTIEGHLSHFIASGDVQLYDLIPEEKAKRIIQFFQENQTISLNEAKAALGEEVTYSELRAAGKYIQLMETQ